MDCRDVTELSDWLDGGCSAPAVKKNPYQKYISKGHDERVK